MLISIGLHGRGLIIQDCEVSSTERPEIVSNYKELTEDKKAHVSDTNYHVALLLIKELPGHALASNMKETEPREND